MPPLSEFGANISLSVPNPTCCTVNLDAINNQIFISQTGLMALIGKVTDVEIVSPTQTIVHGELLRVSNRNHTSPTYEATIRIDKSGVNATAFYEVIDPNTGSVYGWGNYWMHTISPVWAGAAVIETAPVVNPT